MILLLVGAVLVFAAGVGVGRVKNAAKLAAAKAELDKLEAGVSYLAASAVLEVRSIIASIRAKL